MELRVQVWVGIRLGVWLGGGALEGLDVDMSLKISRGVEWAYD